MLYAKFDEKMSPFRLKLLALLFVDIGPRVYMWFDMTHGRHGLGIRVREGFHARRPGQSELFQILFQWIRITSKKTSEKFL